MLVTIQRSPGTQTPATTETTTLAPTMLSAGISAFILKVVRVRAYVVADLTHSIPGMMISSAPPALSTAASHLGGAAPRRTCGRVILESAVKVGICPCPLTVTTPIEPCSVTILIKTVSILVNTPTTPAPTPTPVSPGKTCAKVSAGVRVTMKCVAQTSDVLLGFIIGFMVEAEVEAKGNAN